MLPLCESEGIGVIPWSPLARGLLTGSRKSTEDKQSTSRAGSDAFASKLYDHPSDWDVVEAVKRVADARGKSMAEVSLAWLLSKPVVTAPIIGATKLNHLEAAIQAVNVQLSKEELQALEEPYKPHEVRGIGL
jgi:aryl-alcohol dehydrogenase-like predicted oxidoreductase